MKLRDKILKDNNINMHINFKNKEDGDEIFLDLLEYINIQINNSVKLGGYSNDPSFYQGKIDALQDIQREILIMAKNNK